VCFSCELLRKYTYTVVRRVMADEICHRKFEEKKNDDQVLMFLDFCIINLVLIPNIIII